MFPGYIEAVNLPVIPLGKPRAERADAARNRELLLAAARAMIAEDGVENVTMDALAERAGVGKGTVFRRFGSRAGIFRALLDDSEYRFQERVLSGPPPLGPGAPPRERIIAYGRLRIGFLEEHLVIARAAMDFTRPVPGGTVSMTVAHLRMLLAAVPEPPPDPDGMAVLLTGALEGPLMLHLTSGGQAAAPVETDVSRHPLAHGWQVLIERLLGP